MPTVLIDEIQVCDLANPKLAQMCGSESGRLLRFRNAVLARAETNRNRDHLTRQNIVELAATLPLMAIDIEHKPQEVIGFFTDAREADAALSTDGIIFADRFPAIAQAVVEGEAKLSIEADAEEAICLKCQQVFGCAEDYCDHLKNRRLFGTVRGFSKMTAVGGGVTRNPAGTNTQFDHHHIEFVASLMAEDSMTDLEQKQANAARAAQRLVASFAAEQMRLSPMPQLNMYRPVVSPLTFVENPAWIEALASKVVEKLKPVAASTETTPVAQAPMAETPAPAVSAETVQEVVQIVNDQVEAKDSEGEHGTETTDPNAVAASTTPAGVGLVGFAWDAPNSPTTPIKATW